MPIITITIKTTYYCFNATHNIPTLNLVSTISPQAVCALVFYFVVIYLMITVLRKSGIYGKSILDAFI